MRIRFIHHKVNHHLRKERRLPPTRMILRRRKPQPILTRHEVPRVDKIRRPAIAVRLGYGKRDERIALPLLEHKRNACRRATN